MGKGGWREEGPGRRVEGGGRRVEGGGRRVEDGGQREKVAGCGVGAGSGAGSRMRRQSLAKALGAQRAECEVGGQELRRWRMALTARSLADPPNLPPGDASQRRNPPPATVTSRAEDMSDAVRREGAS